MKNKINKFVELFVEGVIVHLDYCNETTLYVDSDLISFLDVEEIEDSILNNTMCEIVKLINENDLFDSWISSSNEITVERKEYLNFNELN